MNIVFDWSGTLADDHRITWTITNRTLEYYNGKTIIFYMNTIMYLLDPDLEEVIWRKLLFMSWIIQGLLG